jgi:hypothetical protein
MLGQPSTPQAAACDPDLLHRQFLAHFELWLTQRQVQLVTPASATPAMLNACMVMLASAATKAAGLADEGYDMTAFEREVAGVSDRLQQLSKQRAVAAQVPLPASMTASSLLGTYSPPALCVPSPRLLTSAGASLEERQRRAAQNLGSYSLLNATTFTKLVAALQQPWAETDLSYLHRLKSIERVLFGWVAAGISKASLTEPEVFALEQVVDIYSNLLHSFSATPAGAAYMAQELRSRELLVVWAAYCLMDASARHHHQKCMAGYGVSLQWTDLRHLVLSDRAAVDAALGISDYLKANDRGAGLFSLRDEGQATFAFAQQFAASSPEHLELLKAEQQAADKRKAEHWKEVARKKELARGLKQQLTALNSQLVGHKASLTQANNILMNTERYCYTGRYMQERPEYTKAQDNVTACQYAVSNTVSKVRDVERALEEAERAPPPVIQPLPQEQSKAQQWLFFLHMPPLFRHLSRASFLAQQMLLPQPLSSTSSAIIAVEPYKTSLVRHYNTHQTSQYHTPHPVQTGADGKVLFMSRGAVPDAKDVGAHHIDHLNFLDDGVWYPDSLAPQLAWMGCGAPSDPKQVATGCSNPFAPLPAEGKSVGALSATRRLSGADRLLEAACLSASATSPHAPCAALQNILAAQHRHWFRHATLEQLLS